MRAPEEIIAIVRAEYEYWKKSPGDIGISAVGACANILAAIEGFRAPWHPKFDPSPAPKPPQEMAVADLNAPRPLMTKEELDELIPNCVVNGGDPVLPSRRKCTFSTVEEMTIAEQLIEKADKAVRDAYGCSLEELLERKIPGGSAFADLAANKS